MKVQAPRSVSSSASALAQWLRLTAMTALLATGLDAVLLERKKGFFTGGFLAEDYVRTPVEGAVFLAASLLADAAVLGVLVAFGLWAFGRLHLTRTARAAGVLGFALAPLAIANFVSYRLHEYLGDAFDIGLMFELTGRRPEEFFAVASAHLGGPLALITAGGAIGAGLIWILNHFLPGERHSLSLSPHRPIVYSVAMLFIAGLLSTAFLRAGTDVMENGLRRKPAGKFLGSIAEVATDVDRDGYGAIRRMSDPAPFDATIFPYATEIPGNGIDENGIGGDLPVTDAYTEPLGVASGWTRRPNIVLIVLESFRADVVGATLKGHNVTPVIGELARRGVSSALAFSHNGYTAQSRHHLFSGSLAGLRGGKSLIDDFRANGYEVAYFSGQDESFGGEEFAIGFERADVRYDARVEPDRRYSTFSTAGSLAVPHDVVQERVDEFLASRSPERPLLLYVNFHDTHFPYHHDGIEPLVSDAALPRGAIGPSRTEELRATYLNTAANVDRAVGTLLSRVRTALGAEPAVIITADHGESLYDEGFLGHGYALTDVQTRIPLVVTGLPMRVTEPFGQHELRDAISAALRAEGSDPQIAQDARKRVFQYLGTVRRPRQIGFLTTAGRVIYDFHENRFKVRDEWRHLGELEGADRQLLLDLVHTWERIAVARTSRVETLSSSVSARGGGS
jgi:hypothetical protein